MAAVKTTLIKDEDGNTVGQRFEASNSFQSSLEKNYVEMKDSGSISPQSAGRVIRANKKIVQHYVDKGYELTAKKTRGE